ncbi:MAG TPA: alpha/beta hydrolase [Candidatus Acidoferrum sp.]|nr:alpha/beta hydrolase [Candidatus Acidoferrum sp.]
MQATFGKGPLFGASNGLRRKPVNMVFALLCVLPIVTLAQKVGSAQNPPPPLGKLIDVGGYRVHLYCSGTGSPAVVIVGAGYSFDWGLVQPEVAKFTQVCSYDHSGIGWSDDGPKDSCSLRVSEVHTALRSAGIEGPYVLVGHSLGGLVARVYAGQYPDEVAGVVFVDHAFHSIAMSHLTIPSDAKVPPPSLPPQESVLSSPGGTGPVAVGMESDPNFAKLSAGDQELHLWASSRTRDQTALQNNFVVSQECVAKAEAIAKEHSYSLGDKPLIDVSTNGIRSPDYDKLQTELLSLSQNSKQIVAEKSGHFVIIDRPDVVIDAISQVVQSVRKNTKL